jgi:hypothetical protein
MVGEIKYNFGFQYESDEDIPLGVGDLIYKLGIHPNEQPVETHPFKSLMSSPYWLSTSANPGGYFKKKIPVHLSMFSTKCLPVDATPFYNALGKVVKTAGPPVYYTVSGSVDGDVPNNILHLENNWLNGGYPREFQDVKCVSWECRPRHFKINDADAVYLEMSLSFIARREITSSVVQLTNKPVFRGDYARDLVVAGGYPLPFHTMGNANLIVTWNANTLSSFLNDYSFGGQNPIGAILEEDGNDYAAVLLAKGKRKYEPLVMKFLVQDGTNYCPNLKGSENTSANLVFTIPRYYYEAAKGDFLQFTFVGAKLKYWNDLPCGELGENVPMFEGAWDYTDIQVKYLPCDSAGTNKPDEDGDYEL